MHYSLDIFAGGGHIYGMSIALGRPSTFSQDLADRICGEIVQGHSLRTICKSEEMPCVATIFNWFRSQPKFLEQYEKSKEEQADALAEEMLDIADDGTNDWMERVDDEGAIVGYRINGEHVQRSRLRLDTRKWIASKLKPKKYGDRIQTDIQPLDRNGDKADQPKLEINMLSHIPADDLQKILDENPSNEG